MGAMQALGSIPAIAAMGAIEVSRYPNFAAISQRDLSNDIAAVDPACYLVAITGIIGMRKPECQASQLPTSPNAATAS